MIGFKTFEKPMKWLGFGTGTLTEAVQEMNDWVDSNPVIALNVETLTTTKGLFGAATKETGVRVWYVLDEENAPRGG